MRSFWNRVKIILLTDWKPPKDVVLPETDIAGGIAALATLLGILAIFIGGGIVGLFVLRALVHFLIY
jgi:hypothetical protein